MKPYTVKLDNDGKEIYLPAGPQDKIYGFSISRDIDGDKVIVLTKGWILNSFTNDKDGLVVWDFDRYCFKRFDEKVDKFPIGRYSEIKGRPVIKIELGESYGTNISN